MAVVASLFLYFVMSLPFASAAAFVGTRIDGLARRASNRGAFLWLAALFAISAAAAVAWALLVPPWPNNRLEPNELIWLLLVSSPLLLVRDGQLDLWSLLAEAANLSFFMAAGALIFAPPRHVSNGAFLFAVLLLIVLPVAVVASVPPCTRPDGCP